MTRHSADDGRLVFAVMPIAKVRTVSFGGRTLQRVDPNQFHVTPDAATWASLNAYCRLLKESLMVEHIDGRIATVRFPESGT